MEFLELRVDGVLGSSVNRGLVEQCLPASTLTGAPSPPGYPPLRSGHPSVHAEAVAMVCWKREGRGYGAPTLVPPPAFLSLVTLHSFVEGEDEACGKRSVHCCLVRFSTRSAVSEMEPAVTLSPGE